MYPVSLLLLLSRWAVLSYAHHHTIVVSCFFSRQGRVIVAIEAIFEAAAAMAVRYRSEKTPLPTSERRPCRVYISKSCVDHESRRGAVIVFIDAVVVVEAMTVSKRYRC